MEHCAFLTPVEIDRAHLALRSLARWLVAAPPAPDASLYRGEAGVALAFAYLDHALPKEGHDDQMALRCERAVAAIGDRPFDPSLHGGLAGVGWLLAHLGRELRCPLEVDGTRALRDAISSLVLRLDRALDFDLSSGVAGIGIYAAELEDQELLASVMRLLGERAERRRRGLTWRTEAARLAEPWRTGFRDGVYDLGVAHGVAGTFAATAAATARSIAGARELLEGAIAWLLAQPRPTDGVSRFATWTDDRAADVSARAAWCYGDPGIACALLAAADRVGLSPAAAAALEIAEGTARRSPDETRVADAGLCHGSAGLAAIFARLCQRAAAPALVQAARAWTLRTLDYLERDGFGPTAVQPKSPTCFSGPGLLTGAAGIVLTLVEITMNTGCAWDRALGLSVR